MYKENSCFTQRTASNLIKKLIIHIKSFIKALRFKVKLKNIDLYKDNWKTFFSENVK